MNLTTKKCHKCANERPIDDFYKQKTNMYDGRQNVCKFCMREVQGELRKDRPGYKHEEVEKPLRKQWPIDHWHYSKLMEKQKGRCAICLTEPPGEVVGVGEKPRLKRFKANYNHEDGSIRGLLCEACDFALGCLDDNPAIISRALEFLINSRVATEQLR